MATLEQLAEGIRRANAKGDMDAVRKLGAAYRKMQGEKTRAATNPYESGNAIRLRGGPGAPKMPNLSRSPIIGPVFGALGYDGRPVPEGASSVPWLDPINAFGSSLAESVPIVGPSLADFGNQVDAGFASMVEGREVSPEERAGITQQERENFPVASGAGTVAGIVGPFAALGATTTGAKLLGMTGPLWQRALLGAATGGGVAGADTAARGGDAGSVWLNTALGAATGGTFPFIERGARAVVDALLRRAPSRGVRVLDRTLSRDGITADKLAGRLDQIGPDALPVDVGPNMRRLGGAVAATPGKGQKIITDALVERELGKNARIRTDVDNALGQAPIPSAVREEIKAAQKALSPLYEQAFAGAKRVDSSKIALNLESLAVNSRGEAQAVARQLRNMLGIVDNPSVLDPNPRTLFETRKAIDGMLDTVQDGNARRILSETRKQVDGLLAEAVPGIKEVDRQFAELARQGDAFETGRKVLDAGKEAMPPADLARMLQDNPAEFMARVSQGARADIERILGTAGNDVTALKSAVKGDGSWNREKLTQLFGRERAEQLLGVLEREVEYQRSFNTVLQNSETAARVAAQQDIAPTQFGRPGISDILFAVPQKMANSAAKSRSEAANKMIAEALASRPSPEMVDKLLSARARAQRPSLLAPATVPLLTNQGF